MLALSLSGCFENSRSARRTDSSRVGLTAISRRSTTSSSTSTTSTSTSTTSTTTSTTRSTTSTSTSSTTSTSTTTTTSTTLPRPDRNWFSPLPGKAGLLPLPGIEDYYDLFEDTAPWPAALAKTQVFSFITQTIDISTDDQLRKIFAFMKRHNLKMSLETGLVNMKYPDCPWIEGYGGISMVPARLSRIKALGGEVNYIVMDEPFLIPYYLNNGVSPSSGQPCRLHPDELAKSIADTVAAIRPIFPNIQIGDVEAFAHLDYPAMESEYTHFMNSFRSYTGKELVFVHNEGDVELDVWKSTDSRIRPVLDARGVPYGIIWHGMNVGAKTNRDWISAAQYRINYYKGLGRAWPDHNIFQGWDGYPTRALPETSNESFTWLINYFASVVPTPGNLDALPVKSGSAREIIQPYFDEQYYLNTYSDVRAAVQSGAIPSGLDHYLAYGGKEGRVPNPWFHEPYYVSVNPDVAAAVQAGTYVSGFEHYLRIGARAGRPSYPGFDERAYLTRYADVYWAVYAGSPFSGLQHFRMIGQSEGRIGN